MFDVTQDVQALRAAWLARSPAESVELVQASATRSAFLASVVKRPPLSPAEAGALLLADRAARRDLGLSNPAYLAASSGTQFLRVEIDSAEVRFSFSDPVSESLTPVRGVGGLRGNVTELSEAARGRLAARAWALSAEGHEPAAMITLTSPANWEQIYVADADGVSLSGGRILKDHLAAFRKRLGRFLARHGVGEWSALWFLEFQRRGAPHLHLLLFGCTLPAGVLRAMRSWCGPAWSSIVGNPSRYEQEKHKRSCSEVAKMRCKHFGYAVKYATKTEQKLVPPEFRDVGRFWGCWNYKHPGPVVLQLDYSHLNQAEAVKAFTLVYVVLRTLPEAGRSFAASRLGKVGQVVAQGLDHAFGFRVFGTAAVAAARAFFEVAA